MYKISQFSKISGLTIKALRYYDQESILKPSFRDEENQYRYYNDEDLKKALLIKNLRSLEFSIMEIKEIIETVTHEDDLMYILQEKIKFIERTISKEKELVQKISASITSFTMPLTDNQYTVDTINIEPTLVASIRFTGKYSDLNIYVPRLYKAVKSNASGHHFNCYFDNDCMDMADIELCVPIKKQVVNKEVTCKTLPSIKALRTIHYGSYDTLYLAYKSLFEYINTHHIKVFTPSREVYVKGPGMIFKGNPANYITEILLPFEID